MSATVYTMRPYQQQVAAEAWELLNAGNRVMVQAATGAGKTIIGCKGLIEPVVAAGGRAVFVAPWTPLIGQTSAKLDEIGIKDHGIIQGNHWRTRYNASVQVASRDTLINRLPSMHKDIDLLVCDEAHHVTEDNTFGKIIAHWPNAKIVGLSATPCRLDGAGLGNVFDRMVQAPDIADLIEMRFLKPPVAFIGPPVDLRGVRKTGGDWNRKQLANAMVKQKLVGDMIAEWKRHADGRPTIGFAVNIDSSKHYVEMFNAAGIPSAHVDKDTPESERVRIMRDFRAGRYLVIWNVAILTEGFDCPCVSCVILARPTESESLCLQMVGRGLRPAGGMAEPGEHCVILDMAGCTERHGKATDRRDWTLDAGIVKGSAKVKKCPNCGCCPPATVPVCPSCGFTMRGGDGDEQGEMFRTPTIYVGDDTRLVRADGDVAKAPVEGTPERCSFFKNIAEKAHRDGWKPVAVNMAFQRRFGSFPKWADQATSLVKVVYKKQQGEWTYRVAELDQTEMEIPA